MSARVGILTVLALLLGAASTAAWADESCRDFKWDVARERALFAAVGTPISVGVDGKSAPLILLDHLYTLSLATQDQVTFAVAPGRKIPTPGAYAGLVAFKIPASGSYRVSIDMPFWIDVVSNGALVAAKDFEGQHGCSSPHKIVEFDLVGSRPFFLQLSNATAGSVHLTLTASPARKL
jgi:hypothetical protein